MVLKIPDMTCNHCATRINSALSLMNGVDNVDIDLKNKEVRIQGAARLEDIVATIRKAGYSPEII